MSVRMPTPIGMSGLYYICIHIYIYSICMQYMHTSVYMKLFHRSTMHLLCALAENREGTGVSYPSLHTSYWGTNRSYALLSLNARF